MFQKFNERFHADGGRSIPEAAETPSDLKQFCGGESFGGGLYRIHTESSSKSADVFVREAFPDVRQPFSCFAFDWLGRQYAAVTTAVDPSMSQVLLLESESIDWYLAEDDFRHFHDDTLADEDDVLAEDDYKRWLASGGAAPGFDQCIGYNIPLLLGGNNSSKNMEITNMEVYWSLTGQIRVALL